MVCFDEFFIRTSIRKFTVVEIVHYNLSDKYLKKTTGSPEVPMNYYIVYRYENPGTAGFVIKRINHVQQLVIVLH